ncbi:hypothetical protein BMS3Bbin04_01472 [bacterium BMS3Bbin04]|nr:hypothetical protein BMS3Bbin04_01472 [bacterium BMS3Bbin04]
MFYRINGAIYGLVEGYKRIEKQQSGFRLSEGYMAEGEELISAGEKYLREAQGLSGLVISEEMALLIRNYFREIGENYEEMHGRFGADLVFISEKYHKKMAIQAKRELRLHTTTWQKKLWSVFTRGSKEFWLYTNSRIW